MSKKLDAAVRLLEKQAQLQVEVNSNYESFIENVKKYKALQDTINSNLAIQKELNAIINNPSKSANEKKLAQDKLDIIVHQNKKLTEQVKLYGDALKTVNKLNIVSAKAFASSAKGLVKGVEFFKKGFNDIKGSGLFKMEKSIKSTALSMGIFSKQADSFRSSIVSAGKQTNMIGVGVEELAQMQGVYSDELGRSVLLGEKGLVAMGEMAAATGLGAEGAARLAASMENQGLSAERTSSFINDTMNDAHRMGLNASKVVKNITNNMKMLNKYNFKDGVKGLASMASTVAKLGVDMEFASSFSDKLWDVEGAIDMSAQLSVMGGQWANMADPFKLMYQARNDMEGLTKEIANAASASAQFNNKTGEFDLQAKEMHRLKIIAEQTGLAYDDLVVAGKNAAKFAKLKTQVSFEMTPEQEEFLTNTATLDKNGKGKILIGGEPKFLNQLSKQDGDAINAQIKQTETNKEMAIQAQTFDETVTNLINQIKVSILPLVQMINDKLVPKLQHFGDTFSAKGGFGEKIEYFASKIGTLVTALGGWIIDNPITAGLTYLTAKLAPTIFSVLGGMWDSVKWFKNGILLSKGFNAGASAGGLGVGGDSMMDKATFGKGGKTSFAKKMLPKVGRTGTKLAFGAAKMATGAATLGAGMLGDYAGGKISSALGNDDTIAGDIGSTAGGILGGILGSFIPIPGVGTAIGAALGSMAGKAIGDWVGTDKKGVQKVEDGIASPGNGPFTISDKYGNMAITHAGDGVAVSPNIDTKNMSRELKPSGSISSSLSRYGNMSESSVGVPYSKDTKSKGGSTNNGTMKIEFGNITINGTIKLDTGSGVQKIELDESARRKITRLVQEETIKNMNQGKPRG